MKAFAPIVVVVALLAAVPLLVHSNVVLNFLVVALMIALAGQGWNVLGGYGGQYSFGHAAFFGTGAYVTAILQVRYGVNAWIAFGCGIAAGAAVGAVVGGLTFRSGLRGSYFALVTLAFAEVLRIMASVAPITGAGVGTLIKLDLRAAALQFESRAVFYWVDPGAGCAGARHHASHRALALRRLADGGARERRRGHGAGRRRHHGQARRHGRFRRHHGGGRLLLRAIFPLRRFRHRLWHLDLDRGAADPIIGGVGTVFGPLLGALVVKALGEAALMVTGDAPGPRPRGLRRGAGPGDLVHAARPDRRPRRAAPAASAAREPRPLAQEAGHG